MTSIVFGANGQDGFYLTQILEKKGFEVIGVSRTGNFVSIDISDFEAVKKLIKLHLPHFIFHLAANSTTAHHALFDNHKAISTATINILEAVKQVSPHTKVFLSGSGLQFENRNIPIKETDEFKASSAYSVSRIYSVFAARYFRNLGVKVYIGYFFNHESPRRTERHISKMIAEGVKKIAKGNNAVIEIGDMTVQKEWAFAGDIMEAVVMLVEQDIIFEAVIGSGKGYSIEEYLIKCFDFVGKEWKKYVVKKERFVPEYKILISDPSTMFSLGWKPANDFDDLVEMMLTK